MSSGESVKYSTTPTLKSCNVGRALLITPLYHPSLFPSLIIFTDMQMGRSIRTLICPIFLILLSCRNAGPFFHYYFHKRRWRRDGGGGGGFQGTRRLWKETSGQIVGEIKLAMRIKIRACMGGVGGREEGQG